MDNPNNFTTDITVPDSQPTLPVTPERNDTLNEVANRARTLVESDIPEKPKTSGRLRKAGAIAAVTLMGGIGAHQLASPDSALAASNAKESAAISGPNLLRMAQINEIVGDTPNIVLPDIKKLEKSEILPESVQVLVEYLKKHPGNTIEILDGFNTIQKDNDTGKYNDVLVLKTLVTNLENQDDRRPIDGIAVIKDIGNNRTRFQTAKIKDVAAFMAAQDLLKKVNNPQGNRHAQPRTMK